jgi:hypothetical protein
MRFLDLLKEKRMISAASFWRNLKDLISMKIKKKIF